MDKGDKMEKTECRRSSRKKCAKFDVRDLLNKSRKSHKIQIEARIDASCSSNDNVEKSQAALENKQKTFMEKSAIFRRYSISSEQQNNKVPGPIRHMLASSNLSIIDKSTNDPLDNGTVVRNLSQTQEIFSASMLKSQQNSSLIVTQMESVFNSSPALESRKNVAKSTVSTNKPNSGGVQKRRGRPPKVKPAEQTAVKETPKDIHKLPPEICNTQSMVELFVPVRGEKIETNLDKSETYDASGSDVFVRDSSLLPDSTLRTRQLKDSAKLAETNVKELPLVDNNKVTDLISESPIIALNEVEEIVLQTSIADTTSNVISKVTKNEDIFVVEATEPQLGNVDDDEKSPKISRSSESEAYNVLERSSGKIYREGDVLRIKLKRLNIPTDQKASTLTAKSEDVSQSLFQKGDEDKQVGEWQSSGTKEKPKSESSAKPSTLEIVNFTVDDANEKDNISTMCTTQNAEQCTQDVLISVSNPEKRAVTEEISTPKTEIAIAKKCLNVCIATKGDTSSDLNVPLCKKNITLPLKKHVSKLKRLEETNVIIDSNVQNESSTLFVSEPSFIKNVNVETSTLLNILRTVECNKVGQQSDNEPPITSKNVEIKSDVQQYQNEKQHDTYTEFRLVLKKNDTDVENVSCDKNVSSEESIKLDVSLPDVEETLNKDENEMSISNDSALEIAYDSDVEKFKDLKQNEDEINISSFVLSTDVATCNEDVNNPIAAINKDLNTLNAEEKTESAKKDLNNLNTEEESESAKDLQVVINIDKPMKEYHAANEKPDIIDVKNVATGELCNSAATKYIDKELKHQKSSTKKRVNKVDPEIQEKKSEASNPSLDNNDKSSETAAVEPVNTLIIDTLTKGSSKKSKSEKVTVSQCSSQKISDDSSVTSTKLNKTKSNETRDSSKKKQKKNIDLNDGICSSGENKQLNQDHKNDKEKTYISESVLDLDDKNHELTDTTNIELSNQFDDKTNTKKKRQKKLKEAFAAALLDVNLQEKLITNSIQSVIDQPIGENEPNVIKTEVCDTSSTSIAVLPPVVADITTETNIQDTLSINKIDKNDSEDDKSDPLKDIEKFIEDGVNLLNRSYKHDSNESNEKEVSSENADNIVNLIEKSSDKCDPKQEKVDDTTVATKLLTIEDKKNTQTPSNIKINMLEKLSTSISQIELNNSKISFSLFETPADTPINTPSVTPPPKSPIRADDFNNCAVQCDEIALRRSHRIKQITKTPKALVGRGLVRDKERISLKDDVETKSHYSLDDHLMDLAEVEAKNAKFLKEMEERLSNFHVIKENEYKCERIISKEARRMICDCFLTADEAERGELGCGEDCLNRLLMIECGPDCNVKERCTNKRFQRFLCSPCRVFRTEKKGFGIMADIEILPGEFIMEYVGEVIDDEEFERRRIIYSQEKNRHYYFMALRSDAIIDATIKGNISRFINHSCDPNAETQKWTVNGELRIGFFSRKSIMPGEEITFDYQYQRYGREAQRCYCESSNCRGWIGEEPNSDEGEQVDFSDDDNLAESLLDDDDDDDEESDDSADVDAEKKLQQAAAEAKLFQITAKNDATAIRERGGRRKGPDEGGDQDQKNKLKHLLNRVAEKVAKKKKERKQQLHKEQKHKLGLRHGKDGSAGASLRHLEDPDIEDEVNFLSRCGVKTQSDTLRLSRLMVRAKLLQTRLNLLKVLRRGELPCRRLFLDYHGLRLLHGWMSEDGGDMNMRLSLLDTLTSLPITNKTVLTETKVYQTVQSWSCPSSNTTSLPIVTQIVDETISKDNSSGNNDVSQSTKNSEDISATVLEIASKLITAWDNLPDIFRIPKRERIEQMKEHEREADRQYAAATDGDGTESNARLSSIDRYQRDRFGRMGGSSGVSRYTKSYGKEGRAITTITTANIPNDPRRRSGMDGNTMAILSSSTRHLSKAERREIFAAKVARDEAEKRHAEERRIFEIKCRFFGLDPKKTRPQDMPLSVIPTTGQWFSVDRQPIITPPTYINMPLKPKSTNPNDYQLPGIVNILPKNWRYAITPQGHIYYYHLQSRMPQWEPPCFTANNGSGTQKAGSESDDDIGSEADDSSDNNTDDELFMSMDKMKLRDYIENKVASRRSKRYKRLVSERGISPRREEDRIYNQIEVRKYKENKEKIRKRKEEIRRRRAEAQRASIIDALEDNDKELSLKDVTSKPAINTDEVEQNADALPIQDYLLSSSDEGEVDAIKEECNNSPLLEKIVQGDKIVDELDAIANNRPLKRLLAHRKQPSSNSSSASSHESKKRKLDKKDKSAKTKSKDSDAKYRKLKEKFRCEIAGIIVGHLKPYRKDSCQIARIKSDLDFNHLARKLTHFVMIKELKYCESVGQTLVVTESVKNKSREFIKKYMAKYGSVYEKPQNDPEFKDIPFGV